MIRFLKYKSELQTGKYYEVGDVASLDAKTEKRFCDTGYAVKVVPEKKQSKPPRKKKGGPTAKK